MANLTFQRRLAADILKCGKRRVTFAPQKETHIAQYQSRAGIRNQISSHIILKDKVNANSKGRFRIHRAAKALGRHTGHGKRRGAANARAPVKTQWIKRIRAQRKMIRKFRGESKIDAQQHHELYYRVKGGQFKNKRVLLEFVINMREEAKRNIEVEAQRRILEAESQKRLVASHLIANK